MDNVIKTRHMDIASMVREAYRMIAEAAEATGERAVALRAQAQVLLKDAGEKAAALKESGKEAMHTADDMVKTHPYTAIAIAAGVGVLVGALLAKK